MAGLYVGNDKRGQAVPRNKNTEYHRSFEKSNHYHSFPTVESQYTQKTPTGSI
jgi:hypothetical protein